MATPTTVSADQSRNISLKFRKGEGRPITFLFLQDSVAKDISVYVFILQILDVDSGDVIHEFTEDSAGGLTNGGVTGLLTFDPTDNDLDLDAKAYRWKLKITTPKITCFNGLFTVNDDPQEAIGIDQATVNLDLGDIVVEVNLTIQGTDFNSLTTEQLQQLFLDLQAASSFDYELDFLIQ